MTTIVVQNFGKRHVYAICNHTNHNLCTVPHQYATGKLPPNYPVPAIPYQVDYCECDIGYIYIDSPNDTDKYVAVYHKI